ncbi:RasGAP protein [Malassezia brasiliensis]|uniref:RasGAP protein n=1 Tax=Malassezia brasiliensis TaxID=1821822 RepID=A0AAF0DU41_9BASI|nr:RasGAP protein [Malassezia brasiliensis]
MDTAEHAQASRRASQQQLFTRTMQDDTEVGDHLAQLRAALHRTKARISEQSKRNFVLERDVRYLDTRIGLLIANRKALDAPCADAAALAAVPRGQAPDDRHLRTYSHLFFLLQSEPQYVARLCAHASLDDAEREVLLQTVMFTLFGRQYEAREEHLLLAVFQLVLAAHLDREPDAAALLRANSPVSRMLSTYVRRSPAQAYLAHVLRPHIQALYAAPQRCWETDARRVYDELVAEGRAPPDVPSDAVAALPVVQAVVQSRSAALCRLAGDVQTSLEASLPHIPYGIRWIAKQVRAALGRRQPACSDEAACPLLGTVFYLRYVNPAIVAPHTCCLAEQAPTGHVRRALTLLAKALQSLVNEPAAHKEPMLVPLRAFLDAHRARACAFLRALANVGDFYDTLDLDQYVALSRKHTVIHIALSELYGMHALLARHLDTLAPARDDRLRTLVDELGAAPAPVARADDATVELPLYSRWETAVCDGVRALLDERHMTPRDVLYIEAKSALVKLLRAEPMGRLADAVAAVASSPHAPLQQQAARAHALVQELVEMGAVDAATWAPLADEVHAELALLDDAQEEVARELHSLREVLASLETQHADLLAQLATYQSYLQNARVSSHAGAQGGIKGALGVISRSRRALLGPLASGPGTSHRLTYYQLEQEHLFDQSLIPVDRRPQIFFAFHSPSPGTFVIALHYKGRADPVLEMDLRLDDVLEQLREGHEQLPFEYVQLNLARLHALLARLFLRPSRRAKP